MALEVAPRRRFTVDDLEHMVSAGILRDDDPVELLDGELRQMSPIGDRHYASVLRLSHLFFQSFERQAFVSVQCPVRLGERDEPEPDVVLVAWAPTFPSRKPRAEDVLLLVEVADTSLRYDVGEKVPIYARRGVTEVWVVDLTSDAVLTFAAPRPAEARYAVTGRFARGQSVAPAFAPQTLIGVDDILGPVDENAP